MTRSGGEFGEAMDKMESAQAKERVSAGLRQTINRLQELLDLCVREASAAGKLPGPPEFVWEPFNFKPRRWTKSGARGHVYSASVLAAVNTYNQEQALKNKGPSPTVNPVDWANVLCEQARTHAEFNALVEAAVEDGYINCTVKDKSIRQKSNLGELEVAKPKSIFTGDLFQAVPIGFFESCFPEKHGTPRQGNVAPFARGCLTLHKDINPESLEGLDEYSHVWIIFVFHANNNFHDEATLKAKVRPPRLNGQRVGFFATRSPHRINPIGLSLAKLERVQGSTVYFSGIDLIEGTPVLDIKPYHPADCVPEHITPKWMREAPSAVLDVRFTEKAEQQLRALVPKLRFFETFEQIQSVIVQSLSQDPRSLSKKRKFGTMGSVWGLALDNTNIIFRLPAQTTVCEVVEIEFVDRVAERAAFKARTGVGSRDPVASASAGSSRAEKDPKPQLSMRTKEWHAAVGSKYQHGDGDDWETKTPPAAVQLSSNSHEPLKDAPSSVRSIPSNPPGPSARPVSSKIAASTVLVGKDTRISAEKYRQRAAAARADNAADGDLSAVAGLFDQHENAS